MKNIVHNEVTLIPVHPGIAIRRKHKWILAGMGGELQ